ncbi:HEPN domain-containing protein [Nocardia sp. alder85J]|uniref:HEPN domain-containing protein n=1 Tax=Nocardia sp. alder85J TaxID=2862949 RepID=UPI001CD4828E|nr:HEPN domain-containing protein [Nocardia sp. alder85J]MCX4095081.1 HEPN domain-containing protein [Nocardia sp. alder85J]
MTTTFRFRNTVTLSPGESIAAESAKIELFSESGVAVTLSPSSDDTPFSEATEFLLTGGPYPTRDDALQAGKSWRRCLLLACSDRHIGINLGDEDKSTPSRIPLGQTDFLPDDPVYLKDHHGLLVYPESSNPSSSFVSFTADITVGRSSSELLNAIHAVKETASKMTARETLALTLLHDSRFDPNPETKYISLTTAIEALLEPAKQSSVVRTALDTLQRHADDLDLSDEERKLIVQHIGSGKRESITEAGSKLASRLKDREYGGVDPSTFFREAYKTRGKLVHGNTSRPTRDQLGAELGTLHSFVVDLLHLVIVGD